MSFLSKKVGVSYKCLGYSMSGMIKCSHLDLGYMDFFFIVKCMKA